MELKLVLPVPVSINSLYINQYVWNGKSRVPSGAKILSKAGEKSKEALQLNTKLQMEGQEWDYVWTEDKNNFLYMDIDIYFDRRGRDADNILKLLSDSIEKVVYENDSRILPRINKILYDKINPRIEVLFSPVKYSGIFEDKNHAANFANRCKLGENGNGCTRYREGRCSILVDSLSGSVREEIGTVTNPVCTEFKDKK